jgi:hypothetical protein
VPLRWHEEYDEIVFTNQRKSNELVLVCAEEFGERKRKKEKL